MFSKALVLVLLGSSLVVSSPVADPDGLFDTIKEAYDNIASKVAGAYESATSAVNELYNDQVADKVANAKELGKDAVAWLKVQAGKAKDATLAEIEAVKAAAEVRIQKLKDQAKAGKDVVNDKVEKIASETKEKIDGLLEAARKAWNQLVQNAKEHAAQNQQPQAA